jgi:hypothetical protein
MKYEFFPFPHRSFPVTVYSFFAAIAWFAAMATIL